MSEIQLKNIIKSFDKNPAVIEGLNLDINDGEFLVLVGPSGCGKTTTLRLIAGLDEVTDGQVQIGINDVTNMAPKDRDIAMVFQNYALYPHMNVFDNMAFGLKLRKFSKEDINRRVSYAADILDIKPLLERKPKQLSGGQRQRVALGRAIVRQPKAFLFDEPLSNLDAKLRVQMRSEIKKLHKKLQTTMVYVTHDQVEAMTMGDRVVVMKSGIIHQVDTPLNLYRYPADKFVAGFIGSPSMNFIELELTEGSSYGDYSKKLILDIPEKIAEKINGGKVTLGIRPEDIHLEMQNSSIPVEVEIELVEPMGNEIYLYLIMNSHKIVVRTSHETGKFDDHITVYLDMDKAHFFDTQSGKNLHEGK